MGSNHHQYWDILGHRRVIRYLQSVINRRQTVCAYLFWGPSQGGKGTVARLFLRCLLCQSPHTGNACGNCTSCKAWARNIHPDTVLLDNNDESIGIDAIRELQQRLARRPSLGRSSVAFIKRAERMTKGASNALLKTLEDPPADTVLVLTSDHPEQLPATLRSRCQELEFCPVAETEILHAVMKLVPVRNQALAMTRLSFGRPGKAFDLARRPLVYQEYLRDVDGFLHVLALPVSERHGYIQAFLGADKKAATRTVERVFQTWMLLLRDMLFLRLNLPENITHTEARDNLAHQAEQFSLHHIVSLLTKLRQLVAVTRYHVNPQLLVENFFLHL